MRLTPPKAENPASTCAAPSAAHSFGRATIPAEIPPEMPSAVSLLCANVAVGKRLASKSGSERTHRNLTVGLVASVEAQVQRERGAVEDPAVIHRQPRRLT